ncbi:MAG: hydantoinase/oxoprolinase family protein [Hyphomicrobiales bacterium]
MTAAAQTWRIGVDIGGTFTDLALSAASGETKVFKVPTNVQDPSRGALDAVARAAAWLGISPGDLLRRCSLFVHGSTIATNTLLEGKGAKVGLLATAGFRDSLEIRRGRRDNPWDHRTPYPAVLVPRYLRCPVRERIDRSGREVDPPANEDVDQAVDIFREDGVEAVAISLFNSFLNPAHERAVAERARERGVEGVISLSSDIAPIMGEYERTSTAVLNAYVAPRTLAYLRVLDDKLAELGLPTPLILIQSNGGAVSVAELRDRSASLLLSGPAAGVGALRYYAAAIGSDDLISIEIGGTSCDVILMSGGKIAFTELLEIGGYHCAIPSVDVHSIGAGGGTIARVDSAGMLHIGPQGAGALPGPACYGRGGSEATITDAQVLLGRLAPGSYGDGSVRMVGDLARAAIEERIAKPLGLSVERAAAGMIELMDQKLLHAVQRVSTERGHAPERLTFVAGGGAGPLHATSVARALGCRTVYVPKLSGAFCAIGMLNADLRHDYLRVHLRRFDEVSPDAIETEFRGIEEEALATLSREGFEPDAVKLKRSLDMRYLGQQWDVTVEIGHKLDHADARRAFEADHDRLFGHIQPGGIIEITKLRVAAIGPIAPLTRPVMPRADSPIEPRATRSIWIDEDEGWQATRVYSGSDCRPGHEIAGPAIIAEETTTILLGARDRLMVDPSGDYRIELAG